MVEHSPQIFAREEKAAAATTTTWASAWTQLEIPSGCWTGVGTDRCVLREAVWEKKNYVIYHRQSTHVDGCWSWLAVALVGDV